MRRKMRWWISLIVDNFFVMYKKKSLVMTLLASKCMSVVLLQNIQPCYISKIRYYIEQSVVRKEK